jgi:lipoprotein-releasing system ATP-binding protein
MAGLLEAPSSGEVFVNGRAASRLPDMDRTQLRREYIGFVYQAHHLLPEFSALENVAIPRLIAGHSRMDAETGARRLLAMVGLERRLTHRPAELSGGEQQRVAIARALANAPKVLLADEPTGNLDERSSRGVFQLLRDINTGGTCVVMATHELALVRQTQYRVLELREGSLVFDSAEERIASEGVS